MATPAPRSEVGPAGAPASADLRIGAVLVSFRPDAGLEGRLAGLCDQLDLVVIVDNGSGPETQARLAALVAGRSDLALISNPDNQGIAAALNQGAQALADLGYGWCLTMDQDSTPTPDLVARLAHTAQQAPDPALVALVAPNVIDEGMPEGSRRWLSLGSRRPLPVRRLPCTDGGLVDVVAVASGSLTHLGIWRAIGGFDEGLFIDYVDTDYCLRAVGAGYRVLVDCNARLMHRVGAKRRVRRLFFTLTPTFHSPLRRYYLCRNRIRMLRRHALAWPNWLVYELAATLHTTIAILIAEPRPWAKLRACLLGTWDGLLGRWGRSTRDLGDTTVRPSRAREPGGQG